MILESYDKEYIDDELFKRMIDFFYPIGSYYETSDSEFNPNIEWKGTWEQDTKGQTLVSKSDSGTFVTLNSNVGSETKTIAITNLPSHSHDISLTTSNKELQGGLTAIAWKGHTGSGIVSNGSNSEDVYLDDSISNRPFGATRYTINASHTHTISGTSGSSGSGTAFSIIQPSKVCIRWHRIS